MASSARQGGEREGRERRAPAPITRGEFFVFMVLWLSAPAFVFGAAMALRLLWAVTPWPWALVAVTAPVVAVGALAARRPMGRLRKTAVVMALAGVWLGALGVTMAAAVSHLYAWR